jgi:hypothetical protein
MNPAPAPAETASPATAPAIASRHPDTRTIPLAALRNRALIGTDDMPPPEQRGAVGVAAFNASL